jgi:hypothetical protein
MRGLTHERLLAWHAQVQAKLDEMQAAFDAAMSQKQVGPWLFSVVYPAH